MTLSHVSRMLDDLFYTRQNFSFYEYEIDDLKQIFDCGKCNYPFDIYYTADHLMIEYALTGFDKENIHISVNNDNIIINVKMTEEQKKVEQDKINSRKYVYKNIAKRDLQHKLKVDIRLLDITKINAEFKSGLLVISIPINENSKEKVFNVNIK